MRWEGRSGSRSIGWWKLPLPLPLPLLRVWLDRWGA